MVNIIIFKKFIVEVVFIVFDELCEKVDLVI